MGNVGTKVNNVFAPIEGDYDRQKIKRYKSSLANLIRQDSDGDLFNCTNTSLRQEITRALKLGLELERSYRHCYICPLNMGDGLYIADMRIEFQGWMKLAYDNITGLEYIDGGDIRENDKYDWRQGDKEGSFFTFRKALNERGSVVGGWAQAYMKESNVNPFVVKGKNYLNKVRETSLNPNGGPWIQWTGEMVAAKMISYLCRKRLSIMNNLDSDKAEALKDAEFEHTDPDISSESGGAKKTVDRSEASPEQDEDDEEVENSKEDIINPIKKKSWMIAKEMGLEKDDMKRLSNIYEEGSDHKNRDKDFYSGLRDLIKHCKSNDEDPFKFIEKHTKDDEVEEDDEEEFFCTECGDEVDGGYAEEFIDSNDPIICEECQEDNEESDQDEDQEEDSPVDW